MQLYGTATAQHIHPGTRLRLLGRTTRVALAAGFFAIAGLSVSGTLAASNDDGPRGCTLATLKGRYVFAFSTTLLPPAFGVTKPTPSNAAGFHIFNGDGTGTDTVTFTIGGAIILENVVAPISYTVNADCTGAYAVLVPDGPSFDLFIAPDGEQFAIIATAPPGNGGASIDRRVSRK
ncbi:MAG TPA: hypothetical protein VGX46_18680 [Vicinamibacterales bacterium]|jgi:hypothetical protein|nr:hypothetical protein [Vicinamibacterales bacterium]